MSAGPDYSGVLRGIQENLAVVNSNVGRAVQHIGAVSEQVEIVAHEQANTRQRLEELYTEFQEFVATDARQKERQFAATRIIEVRQELDKKYGHYDEVRRHTTGILQASDLSIVRKDTMRTSVEELMMSCRGYWLA